MKICKKCSAIQKDDKNFCIDCRERLGTPIFKEQDEQISSKLSHTLEELSDYSYGFNVGKRGLIIAFADLIEIVL